MKEAVEYEFILPDGSKRYEFVDRYSEGYSEITQINMFMKMWKAVSARRVSPPTDDWTDC